MKSSASPALAKDVTLGNGPDVFRLPPQNLEAERALLGAIMLSNRAYDAVSDYLHAYHFSDPLHVKVYEAASRLMEQGHQANPITLKTYLEQDPLVQEAGGIAFLTRLATSVVTVINASDYGKLIYDLYLRRELISVGQDMVNDAFDSSLDDTALGQIESSEQRLFDLAATGQIEGGFAQFEEALTAAIDMAEAAHRRDGALSGTTTGLDDLDAKLGGLHPSDLIIVAGRPAMGKSALATTIAFNAAKHFQGTEREEDRGKLVAFFSLEMSSEQLATRILAERARVNSHDIRTGRLANEDFGKLVSASQELYSLPLFMDDTPALTISAIRTRCRRLARQARNDKHNGLGLIVIDYLQLLDAGRVSRSENRVQEISAISRGLKALAKELNVPVLALSQLSRAVEQREDKRPQLSDLRESGSIEQDADVVTFIYREEYYLERKHPQREQFDSEDRYQEKMLKWQDDMEAVHNVAEVIVGKQRHGPIGTIKLLFEPSFTHFDNLADVSRLPEEIG